MAMEGPVALPTLPKARVRQILASLEERQKVLETVVDAIALQKQWKHKQQEQQTLLVEQQAAQQSAMADALASEAEQARENQNAEQEAQGLSVHRRVLFPWDSDSSNNRRQELVACSSVWDKEWAALGMPPLNGMQQGTRWKLQSRGALMPTAEIRNELSVPLLDLLVSCNATSRERTLAYCRLCQHARANPDPELSSGALDRNPEEDSINVLLPSFTTLREALNKLGYRVGGETDAPPEPGLREPPVTPGPGRALAPENDTPSSLQLHALKMLLSVVTAIMKLHQETGLENLVEGENEFYDGLADWVKIAIMLSIDPEGYRLSRQLRDLLRAANASFTEHGWSARAEKIILAVTERLDPSMGLELLRGLLMPVPLKDDLASSIYQQCQRLAQLRNGIGAILLSKVIPTFPSDHGDGPELLEELLCSTDAITSQSWFTNPQQLVDGAVSGDGMLLGPEAYGMATLECLLGLADAVLWPDALKGTLTAQFLSQWLRFLIRVQRNIRHMVPEDQAVKVLATHYELEYRQLATSQDKTLDEHA